MPDDDHNNQAATELGMRYGRSVFARFLQLAGVAAMCCAAALGPSARADSPVSTAQLTSVDPGEAEDSAARAGARDMGESQGSQQGSQQGYPQSSPKTLTQSPEESPEENPLQVPESAVVLAYKQAITELERREGPYAPALSEQMLGLGNTLQQLGRHDEAIDTFKRGAHLARINGGLYSGAQIALLRSEIDSHIELGNFSEVDARQQYLHKVERRSLVGSEDSAHALLRQAAWHQRAFIAGIGEEENQGQRLIQMWDLYRMALREISDQFGETAPQLRKPLSGMLRTQYLIAGHKPFDPNARSRNAVQVFQTGDRYRRGETVLKALAQLSVRNNAPITQIINDMLALGDWAWWFNKRTEAQSFYAEAMRYATESKDPAATNYLVSALAEPAPLPTIVGLETLPQPRAEDSGALVVAFEVTDTGRATNIERLKEPGVEEDEKAIDRLIRALRDIRFRPRFEEGQPVATMSVIWSWDSEAWRSGLESF